MVIGKRIRDVRTHRRLQGKELAALAGISASELSLIEQKARTPRVDTLQKLAGALEVSVSYLIGEEDYEHPLHAALARQSLRIFLKNNPLSDDHRKILDQVASLSSAPTTEQSWKDLLTNLRLVTARPEWAAAARRAVTSQ